MLPASCLQVHHLQAPGIPVPICLFCSPLPVLQEAATISHYRTWDSATQSACRPYLNAVTATAARGPCQLHSLQSRLTMSSSLV